MSDVLVRRAVRSDLPALLAIYNHYVLNTHVTFDIEARTLAQRHGWFDQFSEDGRLQCFAAERAGQPIGWACSQPFKDRAAYDSSVETSVYLAPGETGQGFGRPLYEVLLANLAKTELHRAFAGIAQPNKASVKVHEALGFAYVGTYGEVGRKFGRYWDVAWYQKPLP